MPGRLPIVRAPAGDVEPGPPPPRAARAAWRAPLGRALLGVPLFHKILIANAVIVLFGAAAATLVAAWYVRAAPDHSPLELVVPFALVGLGAIVAVNALIIRLALGPIRQLGATAERVRHGDLDARAPLSPVADRELRHVTSVFNAMLDGLAAYRAQLRDIAARALNAQEQERQRIARDLHDETAQNLAALVIRLRLLRGVTDPAERDAALEEARRELGEAIEGIRRYARGLRPPALDELGLLAAVEAHARMLSEATLLPIDVEGERVKGKLSPDDELAVYRIVQEALSNVVRHADASRARVRIDVEPDAVQVLVEDDGRGFAVDRVEAAPGRGLGLFGMRERASYAGGEVQIESEPDRGTRVRIRVPIRKGR